MNVMRTIIILGLILIITNTGYSQMIDSYGVRIGTGMANQYWKFKNDMFSNLSEWKDNRIGFLGQIVIEKNLGNYLTIRPTIGYIQKGYKDNITLTGIDGEEIDIVDDKVILHDISMDFALKIKPIQSKFQPYCLLGLRADYLIDYKGTTIEFQGVEHELNKDLYDDFVDFTYGAILGIGLMYDNKYFIDIEYNPSISKNLDLEGLAINDRCFSLTLGFYINQFVKK